MYHWFFIFTIFAIGVVGGQNHVLHFTENKVSLSECIEDYDLFNGFQFNGVTRVKKDISNLAAEKFSGKTRTMAAVKVEVLLLIEKLKKGKYHTSINNQIPWIQLQEGLEDALESCSDKVNNESEEHDEHQPLPTFEGESPEISQVLNYILVDWPHSLNQMIRTRNGRALLEKYAFFAQDALECALAVDDYFDFFGLSLRAMWLRRAQLYFDDRNDQPYIIHRYSMTSDEPYTTSNIEIFATRSVHNFNNRNPLLKERFYLDKILNTHVASLIGNENDIDIFEY